MKALYHLFQSKSALPIYGTRLLTKRTICSRFNGDNLENQAVKDEKLIMEIKASKGLVKRLKKKSYGKDGISSASRKILVASEDRADEDRRFQMEFWTHEMSRYIRSVNQLKDTGKYFGFSGSMNSLPYPEYEDIIDGRGGVVAATKKELLDLENVVDRDNTFCIDELIGYHKLLMEVQSNNNIEERIELKNKVWIRFKCEGGIQSRILKEFAGCGEILKINFPDSYITIDSIPLYHAAYIYFKTEEGFEKALKKDGMFLGGGYIIVEPLPISTERTV